jgi:hypothetical protein
VYRGTRTAVAFGCGRNANNKTEFIMLILRILFIFCARTLTVVGVAVATMTLGWIITAHAASFVPDEADRERPILCERSPDMICRPDVPGLVIKPATLVAPAVHAGRPRRALTNF